MGGDSIVAAKIKSPCGCKGDCSIKCGTSCCISGGVSGSGSGEDTSGPCVDFLDAITDTGAPVEGIYNCTGGADDQGNWTWSGGSHFKPAGQPNVGPCFGAGGTSFIANLKQGDKVKCEAGSWGGNVGCNMNCCLQGAP